MRADGNLTTRLLSRERQAGLRLQELKSMGEVERMADKRRSSRDASSKASRSHVARQTWLFGGRKKKKVREKKRAVATCEARRVTSGLVESGREEKREEAGAEICLGDRNGLTF